jgi:uncharacterized protein YgiM (DUF1202 family)
MKRYLFLIVAFLFSIGCAATEKRVITEVKDPNYQPKRVYSVSFEGAWTTILKMLEDDRIPIQGADKGEGVIRTDYQPTPEGARYRFDLKILQGSSGKIFLQVRCMYEGKDEKGQFRDYTYAFPRQVMALEDGAYRRIESALFILEKKEAEDTHPEKEPKAAAPIPAPTKAESALAKPADQSQSASLSSSPETPKESIPEKSSGIYGTAKKTAILMAEPSDESNVLMALKKGTTVEKIDQSASWSKVRLPSGETGWLPEDVIEIAPTLETAKAAAEGGSKKEEALPTPSPKPEKRAVDEKPTSLILIATKNVNLRVGPSPHSTIITTLLKGKQVEKIGESAEFTKVRLTDGGSGWVATQFLQEISGSFPESKETSSFLVTKDKATLKENPSPQGKILNLLKKGRQVEKIGKSGTWTKVRLPWGQEGWVEDQSLAQAK